jgi:hypothetical protein
VPNIFLRIAGSNHKEEKKEKEKGTVNTYI